MNWFHKSAVIILVVILLNSCRSGDNAKLIELKREPTIEPDCFPDLGGLKINTETKNRFSQYMSAEEQIDNISPSGKTKMQRAFGNTYWFYNDFK